jgi:hypothetical protein
MRLYRGIWLVLKGAYLLADMAVPVAPGAEMVAGDNSTWP